MIPLTEELKKRSILLLGPRRTGKSTLIREEIPLPKIVFNLLEADTFQRLAIRSSTIRESLNGKHDLIVIDEVQKLPSLMDEVHLMIEEKKIRFLLTGSSARKIKRSYTSLMAGRAKTMKLMPFCYREIPDFDLKKRLLYGALPPVWLSEDPWEELLNYTGDYLREEIRAEALSRNIEGFSRFLIQAALTNTELLNFESIGSDAQVPPRTIREYYSILEDTLVGILLNPIVLKKTKHMRKVVSKAKFYFFDTGVVHNLIGQKTLAEGTDAFGRAFEHFIFQELYTYQSYFRRDGLLNFWRDHGGHEVDFILDNQIGIEVIGTPFATEKHLKGFKALGEILKTKKMILVTCDPHKRRNVNVKIYPYQKFLKELWEKKIWAT